MVGTQSSIEESQRRFQNILTENLGLEVHSPIYLALLQELVQTLSDLATFSKKDFEELEYIVILEVDDDQITTTTSKVSKGNKGWIKALIAFIKYYHMQSKEEFESVTLGEFNTFRLNEYNPDINSRRSQPSGQSQFSKHKTIIHRHHRPLRKLLKGIRTNTLSYGKIGNGIVGTAQPRLSHAHTIVKMSSMKHTYRLTVNIRNYF